MNNPSLPAQKKKRLRHKSGAWLCALGIGAILLCLTGWLTPLDRALNDLRMDLSPRDTTGEVVFLAIDKNSLDDVGVWPWPRRLHGQIVDRLNKAGAKDIIFDVDFSAQSNPEDDQLFAQALARSQSSIALATFIQNLKINGDVQEFSANTPIPELAEHAWLAAVNTVADDDGIVRSFFAAQIINGEELPSVPAYIAGADPQQLGSDKFLIDFSISASDVPTISVADLLNDRVAPSQLKDKTVLIGAHALELRDDQSVPLYGILAGPMLQILATETLLQNRVPKSVSAWIPLSVGFLFLASLVLLNRPRRYVAQLLTLLSVALAGEIAAGILFDQFAMLVVTTPLLVFLLSAALVRSFYQFKNLKWVAKKAEREKQNAQKVLSQIVQDSTDAILIVSQTGKILQLNTAAYETFQIEKNQSDLNTKAILPDNVLQQIEAVFRDFDVKSNGATKQTEMYLFSPSGPLILDATLTPSRLDIADPNTPNANNHLDVVCLTGRDVTQKRMHEIKLDHLSKHDELTGAMRRNTFVAMLQKNLDDAQIDLKQSALFCFDLHRFKIINDTMGREVGDQLLKSVLDRVRSISKAQSAVARLGSNSFGFLVSLADHQPCEIATMLAKKVRMPFDLSGHKAQVGVRIGFASFRPEHSADQWLLNAELALDEAKEASSGVGAMQYLPNMSKKRERARDIEQEMWQALEEKAFHVAYQPQVRFSDQRIIGAEALLRWNHARLGHISPGEFIPIAEANGMIETLGRFALEQACLDAAQWPDEIKIAVNVSPIQLMRGDLEETVHQALTASKLNPSRLQLEVTETSFLSASEGLVETLERLKQSGLSLALDDFGTGYSSYGYLAQLPLDKVKIDQMFVFGLLDDRNNRAMIQSMKTLAQEMGLSMICEGVETPAQMRVLMAMGCTEGQGYLFGKAMPQCEFMNHMKHHITLGEELKDISPKEAIAKLDDLTQTG